MADIVYTTGLPNPPNAPSQDVGGMQQNTNGIDTWVVQDHYGFNTADNSGGYHDQVSMQNQAAPGLPAFGVNPIGVFYANNPVSPATAPAWPFWQNSLGTFQMLGSASATVPSATANGWTFLPGGLIMQWGIVIPVGVTGTENFPTPFINNVFSITTGLINQGGGGQPLAGDTAFVSVQAAPGLVSFNWNWRVSTLRYSAFYWMAIGN